MLKIYYEKYVGHIRDWFFHTDNRLHNIVMKEEETIFNLLFE